MTDPLAEKSWSPYVVGALIGVLSWFAFATVDKPIGVTTAFEHTAALVAKAIWPPIEQTNSYYATKPAEGSPPKIGWEWMLVVGIFLGALLSSMLSGDRTRASVPEMWRKRFGPSVTARLTVAFFAGALMMFGARLAQGCTSGHGISGTLQLALSSWIFIIVAFSVATVTTLIMYSKRGAGHV